MSHPPINVLFLCTHNSARSILAEATLNHIGHGRFKAFSAGSSPRDNQQPNPLGLQVLRAAGMATEGLRSKSWDEFALPDAPHMDLVITVRSAPTGRASRPRRTGAMPTRPPSTARMRKSLKLFARPCTPSAAGWNCWSTCRQAVLTNFRCSARHAPWPQQNRRHKWACLSAI